MITIAKRVMKNGRRISLLQPEARITEQTFEYASLLSRTEPCDELRIVMNGIELLFYPDTKTDELLELYRKARVIKEAVITPFTTSEYQQLEFDVRSFEFFYWKPKEHYEALSFLLDQALLTKDIAWAKEMYQKQQELKELMKN